MTADRCPAIHCKAGTRTPPHTCTLPKDHDTPWHEDFSGVRWLWEQPPRKFRVAS